MADINQFITLGVGTPATIPYYLNIGLGIGEAAIPEWLVGEARYTTILRGGARYTTSLAGEGRFTTTVAGRGRLNL